jgi:uncharacterized protein (TIGR02996 family)
VSSDERGLLAAIVESPDDDVPRLIYADWLDEHGQGHRARLIRVQCESRRLFASESEEDQRRWEELAENDEFPLLYELEIGLREQLPEFDGLTWLGDPENEHPDDYFDRGFFVALGAEDWPALERHGAEAFAASPVRRLKVGRLTVRTAAALAQWPLLARVRELELNEAKVTDSALAALARSPHLSELSRLKLEGNQIDLGVRALAKARLGGLRLLDLSDNRISSLVALVALAGSEWLGGLGHLDLASNWYLGAAGLGGLLGADQLPPYLNLSATTLTSAGARLLASSHKAQRLRSLCLGWNQLDDDGLRALIDSPNLADLTLLDLRGNAVSPQMRQALRERFTSTPGRHVCLYLDEPAPSDSA